MKNRLSFKLASCISLTKTTLRLNGHSTKYRIKIYQHRFLCIQTKIAVVPGVAREEKKKKRKRQNYFIINLILAIILKPVVISHYP